MVNIEILHMGMDLHHNFDYEGVDDLTLGLSNDSSPMASLISTTIAPTPSKTFATPSNLELNVANVAWEILKV
jgi:hypothetical protein